VIKSGIFGKSQNKCKKFNKRIKATKNKQKTAAQRLDYQ
jgi:hypothetical protein